MATTVLRGTFQADRLESVNPIEILGMSQFEELRVAERTKLIDLKSLYGLSAYRDIATTAGSGAVTNAVGGGEYKLATTASGTDSATLESAERGRYVSGCPGEAGIGLRVSAAPVGDQVARWGYYDDNDGFGFGVDADGLFVFTRKAGSDEITRQADWNNDKLDGTGPSKLALDLADGNVFQLVFTYYGHGPCYFEVLINDANARQRKIIVHRFKRNGALVVENPNLPLRAEVANGGTATAFDGVYVAGRQYSVVGSYEPNRRITSERRLALASIGTTPLPTVTMRRKSAYQSVSAKVEGMDVIADANMLIEVRLNPALTGATYGTPTNHSATETAMEADTSATAVSGGEIVYSGLITSGGQGNSVGSMAVNNLGLDLPALQPVTISLQSLSGTGTASVILRMREEW